MREKVAIPDLQISKETRYDLINHELHPCPAHRLESLMGSWIDRSGKRNDRQRWLPGNYGRLENKLRNLTQIRRFSVYCHTMSGAHDKAEVSFGSETSPREGSTKHY